MRSISMEEQSEEINKSGERMTFPPNVTIFSIFVTRNACSSLVDTPQPIESSGDNFEYSFRLSSTPSVNDVTKRLSHMAPTPLHLREFIQWSPLDQMELKIPQKHCVEGTIIGKIHICPFQFVHILYHPSTLVS